jgi:hypothetical protein
MGLFDFIKDNNPASSSQPKLDKIGNVEAKCPHCNNSLTKKPAAKTKCRSCGNYIYVRTRPIDQEKVLVTEAQAEEIEEQWSIVNGTHGEYLASKQAFENEKATLGARFGKEPSKSDVEWSLLNKQLLEHAQNRDWGLYRNARFEMAEILRKESRFEDALATYLEICYLDLNGPRNLGGYSQAPPFSPQTAFLAPGIVGRAADIIERLNYDIEQVKQICQRVAEMSYSSLKLPVSPENAWLKLRRELE